MTRLLHGRIRGRSIELSEDLGLSEGQQVEVQVRVVERSEPWGEGLMRCAARLPTIRSGTPSWMKSTKRGSWSDGPRRRLNDAPSGHGHLFRAHRRPAGLAHRFFQHAGGIAISSVTLAELYAGAYKRPNLRGFWPSSPTCCKTWLFSISTRCVRSTSAKSGRVASEGHSSRHGRPDDRVDRAGSQPDPGHPQHGGLPEHPRLALG